ncbi:hypothetical protein M3A49_26715 [Paraburkholderia sp. CNPSo 3076]|uniref:hypothetical protein n=1 Tax=Paraburkholderia sp. CNPSo 3076 TaxID=2940936 RepID=UPI002256C964|nr:hypothetical protein [Paraburkholderia sp. CNPSo 3076]MCX5543038.1 hypothetical protein [Paraburkholderia sp. CNPSo 3076]
MRRTIFYSWQSDLPAAGNRNLIEDSLRRALRAIGREQDATVEPVLDRDTANLAGAPDIAHSILAKIAMADVFVADVSIVSGNETRLAPNPNVLVETGYAVAELGWGNVLLVQNSAFGGPELLPFDLRARRTVVYEATAGTNRAEARALLQGRLEAGLRAALESGPAGSLPTGREANLWWGKWTFRVADTMGGELFIREVGPNGFLFDLTVHHGAHLGNLTAFARVVSQDLAYCRVSNGDGQPEGELVFRRSIDNGQRTIDIEETLPCTFYHGARAHFGGRFSKEHEPWFDAGHMNEVEVARLYTIVGEHIDKLRRCTGDIGERDNLDGELGARVVWGGVAGLYTIMESIVMLNRYGQMWVAYIDDETVRYFTNVPAYRDTLPATIEDWRSRFAEKTVVYCEPVTVVPMHRV